MLARSTIFSDRRYSDRWGFKEQPLRHTIRPDRCPMRPMKRSMPSIKLPPVSVSGQYSEVPLVFEVSTPVYSPLTSATGEILVTLVAAYLAVQFLKFLQRRYSEETWSTELGPDSRIKRNKTVMGAILKAVSSPMMFCIPIVAVFHSIRVLTSGVDEAMHLCTTCAKNTIGRRLEVVLDMLLKVLNPIDDIIAAVFKQGFLLAGVWFLVTFKNQYVTWLLEQNARKSPALVQNFKRVVLPLNDLTSWVIVGLGVVMAAGIAGVDVRPMLAFGGISGVIVGLSAQSVLANMIAGINLFLSRPFVDGDRVQVFSGRGDIIYNGVVERVNPLRTIIRTDHNYPLAVPNKILSEMVIGNESRFPTAVTTSLEHYRRVQITLKFGIEHLDKLDGTTEAIRMVLTDYPGLNHGIPFGVNIGALSDEEVTLEIQATALKREAGNFGELRVGLMRKLQDTLQTLGVEGYKLSF